MPKYSKKKSSEPLDLQRYLDVARRRYPYFLIVGILRVANGLGSQLDSAVQL